MSPNLEALPSESPSYEPFDPLRIAVSPVTTSSDQDSSSTEPDPEIEEGDIQIPIHRTVLPLEQNLRELLVRVTSTECLETVIQLKLRVISREMSLQRLHLYTPALRELILDGSMVSSLRDVGCGLKDLKILSVNRCGLSCLDGIFGFESLEEIYATDNNIVVLVPCCFLQHIRVIDLRRNWLEDINCVSFLNACTKLEHLYLQGNAITGSPSYRQVVKRFLPSLKTLDDLDFMQEDPLAELPGPSSPLPTHNQGNAANKLQSPTSHKMGLLPVAGSTHPRRRLATTPPDTTKPFTVFFPPKVCPGKADKSTSTEKESRQATSETTYMDCQDSSDGSITD